MKLISMTDFVLEQAKSPIHRTDVAFNCIQYAKFLKQPLTLGMFVPCDEKGNILSEPKITVYQDANFDIDEMNKYHESKERVLFKGFFYKFNIDKDGKKWEYVKNYFPHVFSIEQLQRNTIESLLTRFKEEYKIELTQSAIKQIGL